MTFIILSNQNGTPEGFDGLLPDAVLRFGDTHSHPLAAGGAIPLGEILGTRGTFRRDYADRGPSSLCFLQALVRALVAHSGLGSLLGNHDLMLIQILEAFRCPERYNEETSPETWPTLRTHLSGKILEWLSVRFFFSALASESLLTEASLLTVCRSRRFLGTSWCGLRPAPKVGGVKRCYPVTRWRMNTSCCDSTSTPAAASAAT
jgi:hypothetical protein